MSRDLPIPFTVPMSKAIRAGLKTKTRRILKPQPLASRYYKGRLSLDRVNQAEGWARFSADAVDGGAIVEAAIETRYVFGDKLWVREPWRTFISLDGIKPRDLLEGGRGAGIRFEAGGSLSIGKTDQRRYQSDENEDHPGMGKLRPGMFMMRWMSRTTLTVTSVGVERLQDITEADALAEGIQATSFFREDYPPSICFSVLWDSINDSKGSWCANPWVAVYGFIVELRNIDDVR